MDKINAQAMLHRELRKRHYDANDVAKRMGIPYQTAYSMLHRERISVDEMYRYSQIVEYNFFLELASQFTFGEPADAEKVALRERIKELEMETNLLRRTLKELIGK